MKRLTALLLLFALLLPVAACADDVIPPQWEVPDCVTAVLDVARGEIGYKEGPHNYSKYGEWSGDPYTQWCAEFVCWCVDQVDQREGTSLLNTQWPLYTSSNTGKNWFIRNGRYISRNGYLDNWGYQWFKGGDSFITPGDYIPQPGDWVFFTWDSDTDTDHVAMVEYCTRGMGGDVIIHVIEGNNPDKVQRNNYMLSNKRILGFGTVHDVAGWTMRSGCSGEKVRELQEKLVRIGFLSDHLVDGHYGSATVNAVKAYQRYYGLQENGIANLQTQTQLDLDVQDIRINDPDTWTVIDDEDDDL